MDNIELTNTKSYNAELDCVNNKVIQIILNELIVVRPFLKSQYIDKYNILINTISNLSCYNYALELYILFMKNIIIIKPIYFFIVKNNIMLFTCPPAPPPPFPPLLASRTRLPPLPIPC